MTLIFKSSAPVFHDLFSGNRNLKEMLEDQSHEEIIFDGINFGDHNNLHHLGDNRLNLSGFNFGNNNLTFKNCDSSFFTINLSNATFENADFTIDNCDLKNGKLNCSDIQFISGNKKVTISQNSYGADISFINAKFGAGDISLADLILEKATINFTGATFGEGNRDFSQITATAKSIVSFEQCEFLKGDIDFSKADFERSTLNFMCKKATGTLILFEHMNFHSNAGSPHQTAFILTNAEIFATRIHFNFSIFSNAVFIAPNLAFTGVFFQADHLHFVEKSYFDISNANINCECFFCEGSKFLVDQFSLFESKLFADTISFRRSTIECNNIDFHSSNWVAAEIDLRDCNWLGSRIDFNKAKFQCNTLNFERNEFQSNFSEFNSANFKATTTRFDFSKFSGRASFAEIKNVDFAEEFSFKHCVFDHSFDLSSKEKFGCVVDLTRTKMSN